MGRLCGGGHEISGIRAPLFLHGGVGMVKLNFMDRYGKQWEWVVKLVVVLMVGAGVGGVLVVGGWVV